MIDVALDRRGDDRVDPERLLAHWRDPRALVVDVDRGGHFSVQPFGRPTADLDAEMSDEPLSHIVFLGVGPTAVWFGRRAPVDEGITLREAAALDPEQHQAAMAATAVLAWHDAHPRCERCHAETTPDGGGFSRRCIACDHVVFPRTDPAMIVAVLDADDRLLLGHQVVWPQGRASLLAGFVEAGESAEHAVVREVAEESGLVVSHLRYLTSQPWPFPRSLMLAYVARAAGEVHVDGVELEWARWYSRADYAEALASGELLPPGSGSVASRVIGWWRDDRLPTPEDEGWGD